MTRKEREKIGELLHMASQINDLMDSDGCLAKDSDGAYTHNAMALRNWVRMLHRSLKMSERDCAVISTLGEEFP